MDVAAFLIPASLDAKQAIRLRRFGLALLTYALTAALVTIAWIFDVLALRAAAAVGVAYLVINIALYLAIRFGFNLRFADPSLTRFQIMTAITVVMFIVYHMRDGRGFALFGCFIIYLFGIFSLSARQFTLVTLYTLAAYALVINLLMHFRPEAIVDVRKEWMSWLLLAGFLPCFTLVGGQIFTLRQKLRKSEARFRSLTEMSSDFYWESDAQHRLTERSSASPEWGSSNVAGFRQSTQMGQRRWDVPSLSPDEAGWEAHRGTLDRHEPFRRFVYSRAAPDDAERYVALSGNPVFDAAGAFTGYRGVGRDVTNRTRIEKAQRESVEKLRVFADNIPAMTVSWDEHLFCSFANRLFLDFYGLANVDVIGKHVREVIGEEAYRASEGHFAQALQGHPVTYQVQRNDASGELRHVEIRLLPNTTAEGKVVGCFAVGSDITQHKLTEERIQRVAHHDSLTGLPNRLLFEDRLEQAISLARRNSRHFALLYLDLDKFKPVNDTLGHAVGDELLKEVALRIRRQVRESDTVARMGGDEFTVILHDVARREDAQIVAGKIAAAFAAPFQLGPHRVVIGTSVGIAVYPEDAQAADELVPAADAAMYSAKHGGNSLLPRAA
jgi:diguanylate cyclase (GGDEF)-like protein/PAS domain S-box-containing protein